ncbi:hypothetical protein UXP36_18755 [Enterobacter hormaechei]
MTNKIEPIQTSALSFDPENPRFYRLNDKAGSEGVVISEMLQDESVQELMLSIGEQDYFPGEPLLVVRDGKKNIVVEGNRRLAAVKLLNGEIKPPSKKNKSVQLIRDEATYKPKELPCIVYKTREEVLRYIGYRHITGVKEWDSLSKAKYLKELFVTFYEGKKKSKADILKGLSKEIGSKPYYVGMLLTALHLYEVAAEDDFFDLPMTEKDVDFSYITTALGYSSLTEWLNLEDRKDFDCDEIDEDNLKNLFAWCFVRDQQGRTIVGESRRISDLATIVEYPRAIENLLKSSNIDEAFLYTNGQEQALDQAINLAETKLRVVWEMLLSTQKFSSNHQERASQLFDISKQIRNHIANAIRDEEDEE